MSLIKNIKTSLLKKHIHKVAPGVQRQRSSQKFSKIQKVAMLLDGSNFESIDFAKKCADQLRLDGKSIELLAYVPKRHKTRSYTLPFFTNEDVNWYLRPQTGTVSSFIEQPFDLLINLSPDKIMTLEYICALSSAKFILGNDTDHLNGYYDCLIKVNDRTSYASFMENVKHYLNLQA